VTSPARNRTSVAWLRAQLEDLRWTTTIRTLQPEELRQALGDVLEGRPWRAVER
jgi:hypothetical protein